MARMVAEAAHGPLKMEGKFKAPQPLELPRVFAALGGGWCKGSSQPPRFALRLSVEAKK
jgi:hypothetical protein